MMGAKHPSILLLTRREFRMGQQEMRTFRSRLNALPLELKVKLGEVAYQKGLRPTHRRDMISDLFTEYNIEFKNVGTGTNRHIIRYDGYVIKIALDKEGIADNKQEWVMADKLMPNVAMAYEISKGGHMLVAEYCPAFSNYYEMTLYRTKIRSILSEWAKQFLIGDVGIIDKNYANWGLNAKGEPVCIDYAYLFPVSMNIFTCICGNRSMTMDDTFSKYRCVKCKREYSDAELRMMITQKDRLDMFSNIPGLIMTQPEEEHPADICYKQKNTNPDYPDPYETTMEAMEYLLQTGRIGSLFD
jgi:hypothetical protein